MAAAENLPGYEALSLELVQLERRERELSEFRHKLHDRIDRGFPNEVTLRRERQISDERRAVHRRLDELRRDLRPLLARER
jgi:hypothetical protein